MARLSSVLASLVIVGLSLPETAFSLGSFVTFETGQVRPLALSPDGTRLFVTNTPDNRLEIFAVDGAGIMAVGSVPVGMEPLALAARTDSEVWVVNHLSDSISIVDVGSTPPRVVRTLLVGDEPRDIVFAGPREGGDPNGPFIHAFISTAHRGQNSPVDPQLTTEGAGRADVWVFDVTSLGSSLGGTPLKILTLFGDTPRALAATPDGSTVYAAVFHSGNRTTVVSEGAVCNGGAGASPCNLDGIHVSGGLAGDDVPGGLPAPNDNHLGTSGPEVGLIVEFDPNAGIWTDELGRNWSNAVRFDLPDLDVFSIDAVDPNQTGVWAGVGTVLFNMVVNPVSGHVYVTNTEARSRVRFEGPGIYAAGKKPLGEPDTVRGHLHEARITVLDPNAASGVDPRHLNKHIPYSTVPMPAEVKDDSLATPVGIDVSSDGSTLYVAAFGSSKIGVFSTTEIENDSFVPDSADHIAVTGGGPSGVVLDETHDRLYVLTRFDNSVSVIDLLLGSPGTEVDHVALFNPEPSHVVSGRPFLYDALVTGSNGEASCSSCHVFGDFDSLAWDLGDPDGNVSSNPNPFFVIGSGVPFHPMKGPMTTQTLRGMANHGPMHWRGDRSGGNAMPPGDPLDEDLAFKAFNVAFGGLIGLDPNGGLIPDADMQSFTDFILEITLPPNPIKALDNVHSSSAESGRSFYFGPVLSDGVANCNGCHTLNAGSGFFGTNGGSSFENETQEFKVPHMRNAYAKVGMFGIPDVPFLSVADNGHKGPQIRGFGFLHDGAIDTVFHFYRASVFIGFSSNTQRRDVEQFMFEFDTTLAPIVGQQITLDDPNDSVVGGRISLMIARAMTPFPLVNHPGATECDLIVKGTVAGESRGWFMDNTTGLFNPDKLAEPALTDTALRDLAGPGQGLTYTCAPPGSGTRMGIDRDEDGTLDRDLGDPNAPPGPDPNGPPAPGPEIVQSKEKQKCINELNKGFARVAREQGKAIFKCIKDGSRDRLGGQTIEQCTTADNDGKVARAKAKTLSMETLKCSGVMPDFGSTSGANVNQVAMAKELRLIHEIFGANLNTAIISVSSDKDAAKCQMKVFKAVKRCQDTQLREFNKCKRDGLKGKAAAPGADLPLDDTTDLELCMGYDPKARSLRFCGAKLGDAISSSCTGNLDVFPGCGSPADLGELRNCLDCSVTAQVCMALNAADGLARDCEALACGSVIP